MVLLEYHPIWHPYWMSVDSESTSTSTCSSDKFQENYFTSVHIPLLEGFIFAIIDCGVRKVTFHSTNGKPNFCPTETFSVSRDGMNVLFVSSLDHKQIEVLFEVNFAI